MTLAPRSASLKPAEGPDKYWQNSNTITPSNGKLLVVLFDSGFMGNGSLGDLIDFIDTVEDGLRAS